jgi:hypothetical protein
MEKLKQQSCQYFVVEAYFGECHDPTLYPDVYDRIVSDSIYDTGALCFIGHTLSALQSLFKSICVSYFGLQRPFQMGLGKDDGSRRRHATDLFGILSGRVAPHSESSPYSFWVSHHDRILFLLFQRRYFWVDVVLGD